MLNSRSRFEISGVKDGEREIVTRTFKSFRFDPHPRRKILIIRGELAISVTGVLCGQLMDENTQEFKKLIKLESLSGNTNIRSVVDEILEQCPFLAEDLIPQLASVLEILRNRKYDRHGLALSSFDTETGLVPSFPEYFEDEEVSGYNEAEMKEVKMDSLDLYVELLYEDLPDKVKGARCVWRLSNSSENLVTIFNHDTALNAVFRTLREDYRKSIELTTNLLHLVLAFTKYEDFHPLLITNKICSVSIDIIEFELGRYEKWIDEVYRRKELAEDEEIATPKNRADFEKMRIKFSDLTRKQDQLLAVAFDVVKHLSEASSFTKEVHNRGVVRLLLKTLERTNVKLLTVIVSFLLNMSSYAEAVKIMSEMKVINLTQRFVETGIPSDLLHQVTKLYYNLSFDTKLRFKMVKLGLLNQLSQIYDDAVYEGVCILIMYNISVDHKVRPKFIEPDIVPKLVEKVLGNPDTGFITEAGALLLNLAASKRCAVVICGNNRLSRLVKYAMSHQDPLLSKIIRKVSGHAGSTKSLFTELVTNIVGAIRDKSPPEFIVEALGTLSNLVLPDVDFCELLQGYQLLRVIRSVLKRPLPRIRVHGGDERSTHESLLLEVIIFLGTCGSEPSCADFLIQEGFLDTLYDIGRAPALDTDIRLQLLYAIYRISCHTKSRNHLIEKTRIPDLVHNFIRSECSELREVAEAVWTVFGEYNDEWREKVRNERFLSHNEQWLEIIGRTGQLAMDRATLNQFHARLNAEKAQRFKHFSSKKRNSAKTSSESFEDSDDESDEESEEDEDYEDEDEEETLLSRGQIFHQSEDFEESESDQLRSKSIFDQFKHQFNQEMVSRIYGSDDEEDDDGIRSGRKSSGSGDGQIPTSAKVLSQLTYRKRSNSQSRPMTSKSRPSTAHHSGRSVVTGGTIVSPPGTTRNISKPGPPTRMSSSSSSFESLSLGYSSEIHPGKSIKPPVIVNIKPKESW